MSDQPAVSVVVLSWNTRELLDACLNSLWRGVDDCAVEVIVVDNASTDGSAELVESAHPRARLIRNDRNLGYAAGNNVGIRAARGRYVFLLNSDTEVRPDAIGRLVAYLESHPEAGAVSPQLRNPDGTIQRACMRFPTLLVALGFDTWFGERAPLKRVIDRYFYRDYDHAVSRDVEQPPAAAVLLPRRVLDQVGLLDEDLFLFFNDVDLCRRIHRAGYRIHFLVEAQVMHHGGASTRRFADFALEWHRNRARYYQRAYGAPGFLFAKAMTAWRAWEEWWGKIRPLEDPGARAAGKAEILRVLREVLGDSGRGDARLR